MSPGIAVPGPVRMWEFCPASEAERLRPEDLFGESELEAYDRLKTAKRRLDWLSGRAAAKRALISLYSDHRAADIEILNDPDGRPFARLRCGPAPDISISHCPRGGVCAVSQEGRVGIDMEPVAAHAPAVLSLFMHPAEAAAPDESPELWHTRVWTAKEAVLKLLGVGLSCDPRDVLLAPGAPAPRLSGAAARRWDALGRPPISVEHIAVQDCLIAFAHSKLVSDFH